MAKKTLVQVSIIVSLALLFWTISFFSYKSIFQKKIAEKTEQTLILDNREVSDISQEKIEEMKEELKVDWIWEETIAEETITKETQTEETQTEETITTKLEIKEELIENNLLNIDSEKIDTFLNNANKWFFRNFESKWVFTYGYNAYSGRYSTKNNMIRQLMASRLLAEMSLEDENLVNLHKKNLEFMFQYWYKEEGDLGYIYYNDKSKLWAIAMALRTLAYSPYYEEYKEQWEKLVNTILELQQEDGSFLPRYIEPEYAYEKNYLLTFYSGEAILSLIEYYEKTQDKKYLDAAILSQDYYLEEYVENLEENYYPAYVPWHTMSLNKLYYITRDKKYADAIFVLNDKLLEIQDVGEDERFRWRFFNPLFAQYGTPHSSSDGVYTEWLAYAREIARELWDEIHMEKYEQALKLAVGNLVNLQYTEKDSELVFYPILQWAVKTKIGNRDTRIDTTQHAMDGFRKIRSLVNK